MAWSTSTRRSRLPSNWRTIRAAVLERDRHRCTAITHADGCDGIATEVDHLGDDTDHRMHVLASLSGPCHTAKTQRQAQAARWGRRNRPAEAHPGRRGGG